MCVDDAESEHVLSAANLKSTFPIAASALALAWSKVLAPAVRLLPYMDKYL